MNKYLAFLVSMAAGLYTLSATAQVLQPGFDRAEYTEMLKVTVHQLDSPFKPGPIPAPDHYRMVYRSAVTGLDNRWYLWLRDDSKVAMVSVRGTTLEAISWLENFYSAMIPAQGELHLSDTFTFKYHLCDDPQAAVHAGWMIGLASMSQSIVSQIRSYYRQGVHDFILAGHSQGGAIDFLLTAYLYDLQRQGRLPGDIRFKTYCSAGPKPGNLFFAHAYEQMTAGGWAINVVNPADWVPQTPFSIQTTSNFSTVNPFKGARKVIRKMSFPQNLVLGYLYGRLDKSTRKAERRFRRNLGHTLGKQIKKHLPGFKQPAYVHCADFVRTGNTLVLHPDAEYYRRFPDTSSNVFVHHMMPPYLYLLEHYPDALLPK